MDWEQMYKRRLKRRLRELALACLHPEAPEKYGHPDILVQGIVADAIMYKLHVQHRINKATFVEGWPEGGEE